MTDIYYDAIGFPARHGVAPAGSESFSLAEVAWAAATLGQTPFSAPVPLPDLGFELAWRIAMVWANLTPGADLRRSPAYQRLDPSEKSAVSFFLGQVQAKLFAHRLFGVDVFVHLDRILQLLGKPRAKTRPDFVGIDAAGKLSVAVEAKGRSQGWTQALVKDAKLQATSLPGVVGRSSTHYVHVAYFASDEWCARLVDPPRKRAVVRDLSTGEVRQAYYRTLAQSFASLKSRDAGDSDERVATPSGHRWVRVGQARCHFGMSDEALELGGVVPQSVAITSADDGGPSAQDIDRQLYFAGSDGVALLLDASWLEWPQEQSSR